PAPVGRWNRSRELPNPQRHKCALGDETASTPWRKLGDYARHHLGLVLPPVLVVFALEDTSPWWGIGQMRWAVYMAALFALAAVCPLLVRFLWRTHPLPDGPLRHRLTAAAAQIGVPVRRLLVWETGGAMVNAAVAGLTPHLRYVLLSDGLLDKFDDDAIESVFRHEAAHVRRRHLLWRLLLVTFPVWVVAAAIVLAPPAWSTELPTTALIVIPLVVAIYCGGALCWFSRLLEHDADLEACRDGANAISNRRLQSYLQMIDQLGAIAGDRRTWLHPSLTARRSLLIDAATPARFQQYRRRANVAIATVLFSYLGAMAMFAYALTV
ncbi:MAG: M48 family metalloprotease, partial [Pirellulaceae bacterium]|nr:M48 family metalloprotease [Pirellulaceae bacterium]